MDLSRFDSIPTDELRDLRDSAERIAERFARRGDMRSAATAWVAFRAYGAALASRGLR